MLEVTADSFPFGWGGTTASFAIDLMHAIPEVTGER